MANIVHAAAALQLIGFLFRDQIILRAFIIFGSLVYILYYLLAPSVPLWGAMFWSAIFIGVNAVMIARIAADRTHFAISEDERRLFVTLGTLTPGEFRRFIRIGTWMTAVARTVLTEEGKRLDRLYYVFHGAALGTKGSTRFSIDPPVFIGEVAYLLSTPASATVEVEAGTRYIEWDTARLHRLMLRAPTLHIALGAALNKDMATKVARA
jgi:CRP-like cAMP-binding protein